MKAKDLQTGDMVRVLSSGSRNRTPEFEAAVHLDEHNEPTVKTPAGRWITLTDSQHSKWALLSRTETVSVPMPQDEPVSPSLPPVAATETTSAVNVSPEVVDIYSTLKYAKGLLLSALGQTGALDLLVTEGMDLEDFHQEIDAVRETGKLAYDNVHGAILAINQVIKGLRK